MLLMYMIAVMMGVALALPPAAGAAPAETAETAYVPAQTKVAILPAIDASGEKNEKVSAELCRHVNSELLKQFNERGFRMIDPGAIDEAIKKLNVDLSDEEQRKRATMIDVGKEVGADLVIFVAITDKTVGRPLVATIKVWLLDVGRQSAILSGKTQEGRSGGGTIFDSPTMQRSLQAAVRLALSDFMKKCSRAQRKDQ